MAKSGIIEYGKTYSTQDFKNELLRNYRQQNQRNTFEQMYFATDVATQKMNAAQIYDYSKAINEAYAASLQNQNAILNSNLGQGYQDLLLQENQFNLQEAYDKYSQNLAEAKAKTAEYEQEAIQNVSNIAEEEATKLRDFTGSIFDYYEQLDDELFTSDKKWQRYLVPETDDEGNPLTDENGQPIMRRMTRQELLEATYDESRDDQGNVVKEWTGLYDDQGNLTLRGVDFFDQMLNDNLTQNTFGQYLSEANPELYEWSQSYNPYNYTFDSTNTGTFKTMFGMASTDYQYSYAERFGGMSKGEVDKLYSKFSSKLEEMQNYSSEHMKNYGKDIVNDTKDIITEMQTMAKDFGIDANLDAELSKAGLKGGFSGIIEKLDNLSKDTKSMSEMTGDWFLNAVGLGSLSAATGTAAAYGLGTAAAYGAGYVGGSIAGATTGIGGMAAIKGTLGGMAAASGPAAPIFAAVAAVLIIGAAVTNASIQTDMQRNLNKELAEQSRKIFNQTLNGMINYSMYTKREAEIRYNKEKYLNF